MAWDSWFITYLVKKYSEFVQEKPAFGRDNEFEIQTIWICCFPCHRGRMHSASSQHMIGDDCPVENYQISHTAVLISSEFASVYHLNMTLCVLFDFWKNPDFFEKIWNFLKFFRKIRKFLKKSRNFWKNLEKSGNFWKNPEIFGENWKSDKIESWRKDLKIGEKIWKLKKKIEKWRKKLKIGEKSWKFKKKIANWAKKLKIREKKLKIAEKNWKLDTVSAGRKDQNPPTGSLGKI